MGDHDTMAKAALAAMRFSLGLGGDDRVLVVTDEKTGSCGRAFAAAAEQLGCTTEVFWLPEEHRPLTEVPAGMLELLADITVVINAVDGDAREVPFRIEWIRA